MKKCVVVSSLVSDKSVTQAGLVYLLTSLTRLGYEFQLIDLSETFDYFDAPSEIYQRCDSSDWMNPDSITNADWMDVYLPKDLEGRIMFFSASFSPDLVFHSRLSYIIKKADPGAVMAIGGSALSTLSSEQTNFLRRFFDYLLIGHDVEALLQTISEATAKKEHGTVIKCVSPPSFEPDYSLVKVKEMTNVYSGHGCYYGKCKFCDYPARAYQKIFFRPPQLVAKDIFNIYTIDSSIKDITLTQDSYPRSYLIHTAHEIGSYGGHIPYNLMLRAESWIDNQIGETLAESGCTDVFLGVESLSDVILQILKKGISIKEVENAVRCLSQYVDITIGLILFVPMVKPTDLELQLKCLDRILPHITSIEPEVLTIVSGSHFSENPSKYGIVLNATENILNDSWCFGLSADIPWTMRDRDCIRMWFRHVELLEDRCSGHVKSQYWEAIRSIRQSIQI